MTEAAAGESAIVEAASLGADWTMAAIVGARIHVLDGHAHIAHRTDPATVATVIREFLAG